MPEESDKLTRKWQRRAYQAWAIVGACVIAGIALYVCGILWQAVATVILTALIVFLLHHFVARLQRRGIPRTAGVVIGYAIGAVVLLGVLVMLIPALTSQVTTFAGNLPDYVQQTQDFAEAYLPRIAGLPESGDPDSWADKLAAWAQQASSLVGGQATEVVKGVAGGVVGAAVNVSNGLLVLFISLICAAWVLIDLPTLGRELHGLVGKRAGRRLDIVSNAFGTAIYGWVKSTLVCAVVTGVASGLVFWALGIPYSAMLGLVCAVLYLVPYIGPTVAAAIVAAVALFVGPLVCILSIVANTVIGFVVGNIVSPRLMQSSVNVHPAITLVAILAGGALGGVIGMLLSIPTAAALHGIFVVSYEAKTGRSLGTPDGALFRTPTQAHMPRLHPKEKEGSGKDAR